MPTPRGMNFCIVWKRGMGDGMGEKKYRGRFSIGFNENDPAHLAVIHILERQGTRQKAQFIANAILHYIHCPETPDISVRAGVDPAMIEQVMLEILRKKDGHESSLTEMVPPLKKTMRKAQPAQGKLSMEKTDLLDENALNLIAGTIAGFRGQL